MLGWSDPHFFATNIGEILENIWSYHNLDLQFKHAAVDIFFHVAKTVCDG